MARSTLRNHKAVTLGETLLLQTGVVRVYGEMQGCDRVVKQEAMFSRADDHTVMKLAVFLLYCSELVIFMISMLFTAPVF